MMKTAEPTILALVFSVFLAPTSLLAATCPCSNPADFTTLQEITRSRHSTARPLPSSRFEEVGSDSVIRLSFDNDKAADHVNLKVEAVLWKGAASTPIVVPGFVTKEQPGADSTAYYVSNYQKRSRTAVPPLNLPDMADVDLQVVGAAGQDELVITITNGTSQVIYYLIPVDFGWHTKTSDSVMFIQRRGVTKADVAAGINNINFAPAAGVTYGGIYIPRQTGIWRLLGFGAGLNVMFLDWTDMSSTFDITTGKFAAGTTRSNINVGMGVQVSVFNGILQGTYGWNLQAQNRRQYLGVGVSFVNLANTLTALGVGSAAPKPSTGK